MAQQRVAGARTLGRGLEVLRAVGARPQGATVAELSAETGLDRAVVHRLLATLAEAGFVTRDPRNRRFRLGLALVELGAQGADQLEVRRAAHAALRLLKDGTRESTCLAVRHGDDAVVVDRVEAGGGGGRTPLPVGARVPLPRLAHGRVMLAFAGSACPPADDGDTAAPDELALVRQRGFGLGAGDIGPGLVEVAAPVRVAGGEPVAALGVIGPASRLPQPARLGTRVRTVAQEVSRRLGWVS